MSASTFRLIDYLDHIIEAIDRVERYVEDLDELAFSDSQLVQDAVIRNIEIVGEASRNIERRYPDFAAKYLPGNNCGILANRTGCGARRLMRRSASTASSDQRSNAPVMAAKNHNYLLVGT